MKFYEISQCGISVHTCRQTDSRTDTLMDRWTILTKTIFAFRNFRTRLHLNSVFTNIKYISDDLALSQSIRQDDFTSYLERTILYYQPIIHFSGLANNENFLTIFKECQIDYLKTFENFEWWQTVDDCQTGSDSLIHTTLDKAVQGCYQPDACTST